MRKCQSRIRKQVTEIHRLCHIKRLGIALSESGASAVEFALIMPFLIALLVAIIQFGSAFFLQNNMINVARETARRVAIGELDETQAAATAQGALVNWGSTFQVQVLDPVTTTDPDDTDVVVTITVPIADATIISYLSALKLGNLSASVAIRSEAI